MRAERRGRLARGEHGRRRPGRWCATAISGPYGVRSRRSPRPCQRARPTTLRPYLHMRLPPPPVRAPPATGAHRCRRLRASPPPAGSYGARGCRRW